MITKGGGKKKTEDISLCISVKGRNTRFRKYESTLYNEQKLKHSLHKKEGENTDPIEGGFEVKVNIWKWFLREP